jgi:hypothetical protein
LIDDPREPAIVDLDADIESVGEVFCERCRLSNEKRLTFATYAELQQNRRTAHREVANGFNIIGGEAPTETPPFKIEISTEQQCVGDYEGTVYTDYRFKAADEAELESWLQHEANIQDHPGTSPVMPLTKRLLRSFDEV